MTKKYTPIAAQRVAFIGLGTMGYPMAGHLATAGHHTTVFNRTPSKAEQWVAEYGGHWASTAGAAAAGADMVFCCVGNDADVRAITLGAQGAFAAMKPGAIFVDHTTTSAELARELQAQAHSLGLSFVDAPVSGGNLGAIAGSLSVMCGGTLAAFNAMAPVAQAFAKTLTLLGESGSGQLAKMVNQVCIAGILQGLSEAIAFGEKAGLDMSAVLEAIGQGAAQSWQLQQRGPTMLEQQFDFGFAVNWMRKDLGLVLQEARRNGAQLPLTALVDQFYADLQAQGGGRRDTSSLVERLR
jgi:3-hydroxyisobutyrate dehydrogenase